tara:strand:+ start:3189 stop:6095 length:2907 start_codon:yes stop_codon:yes gene_type:complete
MAGSDDFTGQRIQDSYQRVLQVSSSGEIADGTGSLVQTLNVTASYAVSASHEITYELSSSYAETASFSKGFEVSGILRARKIENLDGDTDGLILASPTGFMFQMDGPVPMSLPSDFNVIGDSYFENAITASEDISASGTIYGDYIVSDAMLHARHHTVFGTTDDDRHYFTGHITSSGNISASGNIQADTIQIGDTPNTTPSYNLHIKDAASVNAVFESTGNGNTTIELQNNQTPDWKIRNKFSQGGLHFTANHHVLHLDDDGTTTISGSLNVMGEAGHITASGNISASGDIAGNTITVAGVISQSDIGHGQNILGGDLTVHGRIRSLGSDITIMSGSITASANISTSAGIIALSGSFGTGTTTITDRIHTTGKIESTTGLQAPGFTASHKLLQLGSLEDTKQELVVYGKIRQVGSGLTIMSGSITASADISMSGGSSIITETGSFNHIITDGNTIEFKNASTGAKEGSLKFDASNGLQIKDANDNNGKTKTGHITAIDELYSVGATTEISSTTFEISSPVTASGIFSASANSIFNTMDVKGALSSTNTIHSSKGISTDESLAAPGFTASAKLLQLGAADNAKQELVVYGKIRQVGSGLTIQSGSITASANISTSANIVGLTGSFGTGTTHIHDNIQTAAIVATGQVKANALRTDNFVSDGKTLQLGSADNTKQELIVYGRLQVKGSDFTIMSGSITASGDISASGNISSGFGGTGSFDHIICSQNSIEFRDRDNDNVSGFLSFDADNGLQPLTEDRSPISRVADKVVITADAGNVAHYMVFADSKSGNTTIKSDAGITYNPSSNTLTVPNIVGKASTAALADLSSATAFYGGHKGSKDTYMITPVEFVPTGLSQPAIGDGGQFVSYGKGVVTFSQVTLPLGSDIYKQPVLVTTTGAGTATVQIYMNRFDGGTGTGTLIGSGASNATIKMLGSTGQAANFDASDWYLSIIVTMHVKGNRIFSGTIGYKA